MRESRFKSLKRKLLPDMVVDQIKEMMADGRLREGDRIPSEIELAEQFAVGRTTVREAIKALCLIGVMERTNNGTYVSSQLPIFNGEPLTYKLLMQGKTKSEVYEARWALEGELASLAALRASEEDMSILSKAIERAEAALQAGDHDAYLQADMDFHNSLADAAGNSIMFELYSVVYEIMLRGYEQISHFTDQKEVQLWGIKNHKRILEAIRCRNPREARQAARKPMKEMLEKLAHVSEQSESMANS